MDEKQTRAYCLGLDSSILCLKLTEYLTQTAEGQKARQQLEKDFLVWQETENPGAEHLTIVQCREFLDQLFPENAAAARKQRRQQQQALKKARRQAKIKPSSVQPAEPPASTKKTKNKKASSSNKKTTKPLKFKNTN